MANVFWPPKGGSAPETLVIADAATTTAPDGIVEQHTTSGTAAAGFGITDAVELETGGGTLRRVMTDVTSIVTATDAAESIKRTFSIMIGGALAAAASVGEFVTVPALFLGSTASGCLFRLVSSSNIQHWCGGADVLNVFSNRIESVVRLNTVRGASIAVATTITLGTDGNVFPLTVGTGTLNSIVATNWQAGSRIVLECASGITITNNVAGTGATILTSTGASIVTAFTRCIPATYNGTNWITEG
jgi:hypothetical protein